MCNAKFLNLLNPVSFISYGFFLYSIFNILTGVTYVKKSYELWYKPVYYSEDRVRFTINVALNMIFALILFDLVNNIGIINFFKSLINIS